MPRAPHAAAYRLDTSSCILLIFPFFLPGVRLVSFRPPVTMTGGKRYPFSAAAMAARSVAACAWSSAVSAW